MKKAFIGATIIIVLLILLGILGMETEAKENSRKELQEVVDNSYVENILDIENLKNNIEADIKGSEVINKDTKRFPVHTVIDGYKFQVEQDGKIKDGLEENNLPTNNITNTDIPTNTVGSSSSEEREDNDTIVKYRDDEKTGNGITISTTKDGIVTINGKSTDKLYIKISNNIQISNETNSFEKWKEEDGIIIEKGKRINQKVTIINNNVAKGQVNVVLRTEENEATGILKLAENNTEYNTVLTQNIIANYIYIDKNVEIDDMRFKVEIKEVVLPEKEISKITFNEEIKADKGIECIIDKEGKIKLNGTAKDKLFVKVTNGIDIKTDGNKNLELAGLEPIIVNTGKKIRISVEEIQGKCVTTNGNQEFNVVLKYENGDIATKCETRKNNFSQEFTPERNISMIYLYISPGVTFEDYTIKVNIY